MLCVASSDGIDDNFAPPKGQSCLGSDYSFLQPPFPMVVEYDVQVSGRGDRVAWSAIEIADKIDISSSRTYETHDLRLPKIDREIFAVEKKKNYKLWNT